MLAAVLHGAKNIRIEPRPVPALSPGMVLLRVRRAGICGSDLHYFAHGYCGGFVPTRPFVLGHELTADVAAVAPDVATIHPGARVAVNPACPCGKCDYCAGGRGNLCPHTIMLGSASTVPPTDGAFAQYVAVRASQCHLLPPEMDDGAGALLEPLAVALHAVKRPGPLAGKRILVTGGGPIGLLVAQVARVFGATLIALSDPLPERRKTALAFGVDAVVDPASQKWPRKIQSLVRDGFDVVFEASGAPAALRQGFEQARRGGTIVQIGTLGAEEMAVPANQIMSRELQWIGSFRYGDIFAEAIELAISGRVKLEPLISAIFPLSETARALEQSLRKEASMKVQVQIVHNS
jgi:2-desacetyl-2-hydroxyethyl bacteriochlorophyllide A dehydrogenase